MHRITMMINRIKQVKFELAKLRPQEQLLKATGDLCKQRLGTVQLMLVCLLTLLVTENVYAQVKVDYCKALATPNYNWADKSVSVDTLQDQFIYLVDGTGYVYKDFKNLNEDPERYINNVFSAGRLPTWLNETYKKHIGFSNEKGTAKVDVYQGTDAPVFYYGLSQSVQQNWMSDYIHFENTDVKNLILNFSRKRLPYSSYGVTSISNSMLMHTLYRCNAQPVVKNQFVKSLFIVNISDNGTNFNPNVGVGEILEIQRKNSHISGVDKLYKQLQLNRQYYNLTQVSSALFESRKKGYQENLAYRFGKQCDRQCKRSLSASFVEVSPALPLDTSKFYAVEQVPEFKYVSDGYRLQLSVKESKDKEAGYTLKSICISPERTENFDFQWQCYTSDQEWKFDWLFGVKDYDEDKLIKPRQLKIRSLYHYNPVGFDVGLMVERTQSVNVSYQQAGELVNGKPISRRLLTSYKGQNLELVRLKENEKIESSRITKNLIKQGVVAVIAMLSIVGIWRLFAFVNRRFKKPVLLLTISTKSHPMPGNSGGIDDDHKPIALATFHHALDDPLLHKPETLSAYLELKNTAGPNKEGAWEEILVKELGIKINHIEPESVRGDSPLLISNQPHLKSVTLREPEMWPIIFDIKKLKNIEQSEFSNSSITLHGEVYVQASSSNGTDLTTAPCAFQLTVHLSPATYQFEANLTTPSWAEQKILEAK